MLQNALAPERRTGLDQQLSVVPSVTHVYVSNDLQVWLAEPWSLICIPEP